MCYNVKARNSHPISSTTEKGEKMKRPTGITIIAVLMFIGGALSVIGALTAFGAGLAGSGIWSLVIGVADLVLAWGLWTLKPWAWMGALGLLGFGALSVIIQLIAGWLPLVSA